MIRLCCALAVLPIACGLIDCGGSSFSAPPAPQPTAMSTTLTPPVLNFRFVNGSPGTGNVDVYLYQQGGLRATVPTFSNVSFGSITPFAAFSYGFINMDVLRAGATPTSLPILSQANLTQLVGDLTGTIIRRSVVLEGTPISGTRIVGEFPEPAEEPGQSALVIHHASPAANILTKAGPIGVGIYSAATYPPGTVSSAISAGATQQLYSFSLTAYNAIATPLPNTAGGGFIFITPFPIAPFPSAVGFALGLPSTGTTANAPLTSVVANAALSETANENSPYPNQNAISNNTTEIFASGTHISEFLIDADQNGNIGLTGTVDP